jgi:hypothetical protein
VADEIRTGVVFEGEDDLSKVADKIADNVERSGRRQEDALEDVEKQAKETEGSMEALAIGVTGVASAMQIASEMSQLLREAVMVVTEASLAQRTENDEGLKTYNELRDTMEDLAALLGDVLIPVANGLFRAFEPILESMDAWLESNREMVASGIGDFLEGLAKFLINGVAVGLKVVIGGWAALRTAVALVTAAVAAWVSVQTRGLAAVLGAINRAAEAIGAEGLAGKVAEAEAAMRGMSATMSGVASEAVADVGEIWAGYNEIATTIDQATIPALEAAGRISEEVSAQAAKGVDKVRAAERRRAEELAEDAAAAKAAADARAKAEADAAAREEKARAAYYARLARLAAARKAQLEEERQLQEKLHDEGLARTESMIERGEEAGSVFGNMAAGLADSTANAADVIKTALAGTARLIFDLVKRKVVAYAAEAAAAAFAAHQGIPFAGFAIGAAASGAAFGFVEALLSNIPGFAMGGTIPGGASVDSVLVRTMPRERIMSHADIARTGSVLDRFLSGELNRSNGTPAASPSRTVVFQSMFPFATQTEFDSVTRRNLMPSVRRVEEELA